MFPLCQSDLPTSDISLFTNNKSEEITRLCPTVDYTPAEYITLFFTDIGIITPTAVAEEFLNMI